MSDDENANQQKPVEKAEEKPDADNDPYKKYKDFKWENPDEFRNGPIGDESRKCRDIICCIIFLAFLVGCIVVACLGFVKGHPSYLIYPYDEDGKACGHSSGYKDYPYIYFYEVISNVKQLNASSVINGICVKECPTEKDVTKLKCKGTKKNPNCTITPENYYQSKPILNSICFPMKDEEMPFDPTTQEKINIYDPDTGANFTKIVDQRDIHISESDPTKRYILIDKINGGDAQDSSAQLINWSYVDVDRLISWITDLYTTRWAIAGSLGWSFALAMLFLLFLRFCAGFIVFCTIIIIQGGLIVLAVYFKITSDDHEEQDDSVYENTMVALFWVCLILAIIWFVFIIVMCNRIRLAVALIEVTSKYINENCCIIFIPFLFFIIAIIWIAYWIILSIFIYATGDLSENSKVIATFEWDQKIRYSWWFHLFALFYMTAIISAYSQFVYSSSACIWYFTSEKNTEEHWIKKSFKRGIRYHFGSLAFGALIVAICQCIMLWFEYVKKKVDATLGKKVDSKCFKCIISSLQCCVGCIAKIMEFINEHAYIQIALKGDSFCTAAWEGFALIVRNLGRFSTLTLIGSLFTIIGTIFISVSSAFIGYFLITKVSYFSDDLNSCVLPVVAFGMVGFMLGLVTMSIFGISGDALMHSFLLDEELNKGQAKSFPELQKFMSDER